MNRTIELDSNKLCHKQKKQICPSCGQKTYVRYINSETFEYLPYEFGRCDREEKCQYFVKPGSEYFQSIHECRKPVDQKINKPSFIAQYLVPMSMKGYNSNILVKFLFDTFGYYSTTKLIKNFLIGTSKHWPGATIFWQIDKRGKVRTGKIMLYKSDGHRDKTNKVKWVHKILRLQNFNLYQCFFGEHQLIDADQDTTIAIVESEKTAIIATQFLPQYIWLATGGETMLNAEKCRILIGRKVVFFPDLADKARERWTKISTKVNEQYGIQSIVSHYLDEINDGSDIADHLLASLNKL